MEEGSGTYMCEATEQQRVGYLGNGPVWQYGAARTRAGTCSLPCHRHRHHPYRRLCRHHVRVYMALKGMLHDALLVALGRTATRSLTIWVGACGAIYSAITQCPTAVAPPSLVLLTGACVCMSLER